MCPECGQPAHAYVEQCPAATLYHGGGTSACEHWNLQHGEARALAILLDNGTITETEFYEELIVSTEMMHNVGECGLPGRML